MNTYKNNYSELFPRNIFAISMWTIFEQCQTTTKCHRTDYITLNEYHSHKNQTTNTSGLNPPPPPLTCKSTVSHLVPKSQDSSEIKPTPELNLQLAHIYDLVLLWTSKHHLHVPHNTHYLSIVFSGFFRNALFDRVVCFLPECISIHQTKYMYDALRHSTITIYTYFLGVVRLLVVLPCRTITFLCTILIVERTLYRRCTLKPAQFDG